jgi:hypothetical protein
MPESQHNESEYNYMMEELNKNGITTIDTFPVNLN